MVKKIQKLEVTCRRATGNESEFVYQTKKAAFKEYIEKVWGWDEGEQRKLHERRFASQSFQVRRENIILTSIILNITWDRILLTCNPEIVGSNPTTATNFYSQNPPKLKDYIGGFFIFANGLLTR
jgi:hypothetical protein